MVVQHLSSKSTLRGRQLNRPQEVGNSLELGTNGENLVNNVLNALESLLSKSSLNNSVGTDGQSLARDFAETSLVDDVLDRLKTWVTVSNEGLDQSKHFDGGGIDADEDAIVELSKSQKLKDLLHFRRDSDDTTNTDNEDQLLLRSNEDLVVGFGVSAVVDGGSGELISKKIYN